MPGRVARICDGCGAAFSVYESEIRKGGGKFCTRTCYLSHRTLQESRTCGGCGCSFAVQAGELRKGGGKFCSVTCKYATLRGERHVRFAVKIERPCMQCGVQMRVIPARADSKRFCSIPCRSAWSSAHQVGEANPRWKGGRALSLRRFAAGKRHDPQWVLTRRMRAGITQSLKRVGQPGKNGLPWAALVGYTVADLRARLGGTMPEGYSWQDFLDGRLHIDHIIPVSAFCFTGPDDIDFRRCWALSNLQLLPAIANMSKSNRLAEPFQPALPIAIG